MRLVGVDILCVVRFIKWECNWWSVCFWGWWSFVEHLSVVNKPLPSPPTEEKVQRWPGFECNSVCISICTVEPPYNKGPSIIRTPLYVVQLNPSTRTPLYNKDTFCCLKCHDCVYVTACIIIVHGFRPESEKFRSSKKGYHRKGHLKRSKFQLS